mmetsp:Transcript_114880/g.199019  ORF Transcript_114880/g.199019 Transcript_114880/m.199019 type:complete len:203 (-) Transcript_114880:386-994(-)
MALLRLANTEDGDRGRGVLPSEVVSLLEADSLCNRTFAASHRNLQYLCDNNSHDHHSDKDKAGDKELSLWPRGSVITISNSCQNLCAKISRLYQREHPVIFTMETLGVEVHDLSEDCESHRNPHSQCSQANLQLQEFRHIPRTVVNDVALLIVVNPVLQDRNKQAQSQHSSEYYQSRPSCWKKCRGQLPKRTLLEGAALLLL